MEIKRVNEIDNFLLILKVLWEKYPNFRFGQLIHILTNGNDPYNWEKNNWLEKMIKLINEVK